jgi:hypothetical protein
MEMPSDYDAARVLNLYSETPPLFFRFFNGSPKLMTPPLVCRGQNN